MKLKRFLLRYYPPGESHKSCAAPPLALLSSQRPPRPLVCVCSLCPLLSCFTRNTRTCVRQKSRRCFTVLPLANHHATRPGRWLRTARISTFGGIRPLACTSLAPFLFPLPTSFVLPPLFWCRVRVRIPAYQSDIVCVPFDFL